MANGKKKKKKKVIIFSGIGLLVLILAIVVIFGGNKEKIVTVQTDKVKRMTLTQVVEATGKIQPQVQVKINAEVSGEIVEIPVKEGDVVRKGQLLCKIKPDAYLADKEQAVANVNRAKAYLVQRQADLVKTESEFKRQSGLHEKGLISDTDFETIRNSYEVAKSNVDAARFDVQNNQAYLNRQNENLRKTSIYSPIDGVVSQLISKAGERVSGSSFTQGTEIMTVSDLSIMEARVDVNENDVILIHLNDTARVEVDAFPDRIFNAIVYQIANTATTKSAGTQEEVTNFEIRLVLLDKDVVFRPGMSTTARIETQTKHNVLAVPLQCVTTREERKEEKKPQQMGPEGQGGQETTENKAVEKKKPDQVVFLVNNGTAKKQPVKTGISSDTFIEIIEGLQEGQEVIKGSYRAVSRDLEDNTKIRIDNSGAVGPAAQPEK
jgi:HlyD family secretion protein